MNTPVRTLHVCQPTVDGAPNVLLSLAKDQLERQWDVSVAGPASSGYLLDRAKRLGAHTYVWEARRSPGPSLMSELNRLREIVRQSRPDVVHLHSSKAGLVGRLLLRGSVPTIFEPHAWSYEAVSGGLRTASIAWERLARQWTSLTLCVSEAERLTGDRFGTLSPRTVVIPNGVDTTAHQPLDRATCRAELGLEDAPLALCIGRLTRQKGQDVLLRAWPKVRAEVPNAQLAIVGDGPDLEALKALNVEGVSFHANQRPQPWFGAADVVVMPSRWEGMPLILLEAMAGGRSVVATRVAGIEDATGPGDHLVPPDDPETLATAVACRLKHPGMAAAEANRLRELAVADFDVTISCERVAQLTQALCA